MSRHRMAGGPNAQIVPCWRCAGAADRIAEGLETDYFRCRVCGHEFGICFDEGMGGGGPPDRPLYPPTPEDAEAIRRHWRDRDEQAE